MADPIFAKSDAADATYSGVAFTNDIRTSWPDGDGQIPQPSITDIEIAYRNFARHLCRFFAAEMRKGRTAEIGNPGLALR
ncbi:hypothetical protein NJB14191_06060 [Mycobacterium montefiorense]|uniref:Uncharacterized protein n=1 Tax=Mycobacterium montefiorense TaxID=154654 RepID=A0AA37PPM1_9MYCO|nr:hypothetical protein NJB14191_06060 [Mycobacterium montefiorense]GKU41814.1 hypothetical protein NJB14192_37970 [Mycobacterium montefiorense]GKU44943.1 hypothetical protein NJB14194_15670 [Mycobacterium montefiorense]GKU52237.1 hypothetical protein NJB14195_34810 [Mycobacterium montefiorense]GKU63403.1 hypothetical protein NJB18182_39030 [Mycobacterium montefiorense]